MKYNCPKCTWSLDSGTMAVSADYIGAILIHDKEHINKGDKEKQ